MQETRWHKIEQIFFEAAALQSPEREKFVIRECGADNELREAVLELLREDDSNNEFLSEPIFTDGLRLLNSNADVTADLNVHEEFGRYKIVRVLGRGGMGTVFLAHDDALDRDVALKILPAKFAEDSESVQRFRQEARAASAVSHPNVAHIYEFGKHHGKYFLAMEYVAGETLRERLKQQLRLEPARVFEIGRQMLQALEIMHERGIIHRDIKPENIVITAGGQIKILDFGLAKFSPERRANSKDEDSFNTTPGVVLGTSAYMSPEQVRGGGDVDEATDLWSLTVVLYEMLCGDRPFQGETPSDVRASILRDAPSLENLDDAARQFFHQAFAPDKAERFRSLAEMRRALNALEQKYAANGSAHPQTKLSDFFWKRTGLTTILLICGVSALTSALVYIKPTPRDRVFPHIEAANIRRLSNNGKAKFVALAPDGQMVAYSVQELSGRAVYLLVKDNNARDFERNARLLIPPTRNIISQFAFSPDKQFLYYKSREPDKTFGDLYRVSTADGGGSSSNNGAPQKIVERIHGAPTFSPTGREIAFFRLNPSNSYEEIFIADADTGSNERVLYRRARPDFIALTAQPSWSPDGATIICAGGTYADDSENYNVYAINARTGAAQPVLKETWGEIWATEWLRDGSGFVFTGHREKLADNNQLWLANFNTAATTPLTADYNDYYSVSAAEVDGQIQLVSLILERKAQIYRVSVANKTEPAAMLTAEGDHGFGLSVGVDNTIFYGSTRSGNPDLWRMSADGSNVQQLTTDAALDSQPSALKDGRYVVFGSYRTGVEALWRIRPDGSEPTLLTTNIMRDSLAASPDGKWIYYRSNARNAEAIWRVSIDGGAPEKFAVGNYKSLAVSPDGKLLAATAQNENQPQPQLAILNIDQPTAAPSRFFPLKTAAKIDEKIRFMPDGQAVAYIAEPDGIGNLWAQPLDGAPPRQLTNFRQHSLYSFDFSADGREILCARGDLNGFAVLINLKKE